MSKTINITGQLSMAVFDQFSMAVYILHSRGIDAVILPRENSSTLSRGSPYRAKIVRRTRFNRFLQIVMSDNRNNCW